MTTTELAALSNRDFGELLDKALAQIQDGLDRGEPSAASDACDALQTLLMAQPKRGEQLARLIGTMKSHPTLRP